MVKLTNELFKKLDKLKIATEDANGDKEYVDEVINSIYKQFTDDIRNHMINRIFDARCIGDTIEEMITLYKKAIKFK